MVTLEYLVSKPIITSINREPSDKVVEGRTVTWSISLRMDEEVQCHKVT